MKVAPGGFVNAEFGMSIADCRLPNAD